MNIIDSRHIVVTKWFQGWSGLKNGALLVAADEAGFDLFITADQEISYQQNLTGRRMVLLVFDFCDRIGNDVRGIISFADECLHGRIASPQQKRIRSSRILHETADSSHRCQTIRA